MNNEEKILQMLEQMNARFDAMATKTDLQEVQANIKRINQSVTKLEALPKRIEAIAEGQTATNDKLDRLQTQMNSVETKLENSMIIKAVTPR